MKTKKFINFSLLCLIIFSSCKNNLTNIKTSNLKDNFYEATNKEFLIKNYNKEFPAFYMAYDFINQNEYKNINLILTEIKKDNFNENYPELINLKELYKSASDFTVRNNRSKIELKKILEPLEKCNSIEELIYTEKEIFKKTGFSLFLNFNLFPLYNTIQLDSLNLSSYINNETLKNNSYKTYISNIFDYYDDNSSKTYIVNQIIKLEKKIYYQKTNHSNNNESIGNFSFEQIQELYENIDFLNLYQSYSLPEKDSLFIENFNHLKYCTSLLKNENLNLLKYYYIYRFIDYFIKDLDINALTIRNNFYRQLMKYNDSDITQKLLEDIVISEVLKCDSLSACKLFEALCKNNTYSAEFIKLTNNIKQEFCNIINNSELLNKSQKNFYVDRINDINLIISNTINNDKIKLNDEVFFKQFCLLNSNNKQQQIINFYNFDPNKYFPLNSYETNAKYIPATNTIYCPQAFIQEPFFSNNYPFEQNLGKAGMIIAHEIAHAISINSYLIDSNNYMFFNFKNTEYENYRKWQDSIINFYNGSKELDGFKQINKNSFSENIADFLAMETCIQVLNTKQANGNQINYKYFFESYAQMRTGIASQFFENLVYKDGKYSLYEARVNKLIVNFDEFYETYDISANDKMFVAKSKRVKNW